MQLLETLEDTGDDDANMVFLHSTENTQQIGARTSSAVAQDETHFGLVPEALVALYDIF